MPLQGFVKDSSIWDRDFVFEQGKHYLVNAASGKGKTTLLSVIYGLRHDYTGNIIIQSKNIQVLNHNDWSDYRMRNFSMLFQDLRLFPVLTALENIQIKNSLTQHYTLEQITSMAEQLGVDMLLQRTCDTLSLGQQQRIALIRCMCQPFEWLLLDEPFSHLDMDNARKCMQLIKTECEKRNAGMILTSLGEYIQDGFDNKIEI